jgi:hypothetical protein
MSTTTLSYNPTTSVPLEIWLEIFYWATTVAEHLYSIEYDPFQPPFAKANEQRLSALQTKGALALVCRSWNQLIQPSMHDELYLNKDDLSQSKDAHWFERTRRTYHKWHSSWNNRQLISEFMLHSSVYAFSNAHIR